METINNILLERRLITRSRWTLLAAAVLVAIAVWSGFVNRYLLTMSCYRWVVYYREYLQQHQMCAEQISVLLARDVALVKAGFEVLHPQAAPNHIMSIFAAGGLFITAILGAVIVGSEFTRRTAKVRAAHYGWGNSIVAKLISIIFISAIIALAGFLIGVIGGNIVWSVATGASQIARLVEGPYIAAPHWQQILLVTVGLSFYGMLAILIAAATRSTLAGALGGVLIPVVEVFAVDAFPHLWWLPMNIYTNLVQGTFTFFEAGGVFVCPPHIVETPLWLLWFLLIGWGLILFLSAWQLAKRQAV